MGFRIRRSVRVAPGIRLNFGKRGTNVSVGGRGITTNFSKRGTRTTYSLRGTGISYVTNRSGGGLGSAILGLIIVGSIIAAIVSRM